MITFYVEGQPAPKGSYTPIPGHKHGMKHNSKYLKSWTENVAYEASKYKPIDHKNGYTIEKKYFFTKPKNPKWDYPAQTDLDKLDRAVGDALVAGGLIADDRYIRESKETKAYCDNAHPIQGCEITIGIYQPTK